MLRRIGMTSTKDNVLVKTSGRASIATHSFPAAGVGHRLDHPHVAHAILEIRMRIIRPRDFTAAMKSSSTCQFVSRSGVNFHDVKGAITDPAGVDHVRTEVVGHRPEVAIDLQSIAGA